MGNRYWSYGGISYNWSDTSNWATSSSGAGNNAVPTSIDDVFFDNFSTICTVNSTANYKSVTCTGYTNNMSLASGMTASGSIALVPGMGFDPGTNRIDVISASTINSAGKSFYQLALTNAPITLSTDVITTNTLFLQTESKAITGAYTFYVQGDIDVSNTAYFGQYGTSEANIVINGSGSQAIITGASAFPDISMNVNVNKGGGTLTINNNLQFGYSQNCTWTFTAGTVSCLGTFYFRGAGKTHTLNSNGMSFNNLSTISESPSINITSPLDINNNFNLNGGTVWNANGNQINVGGSWTKSGTFNPGGNTVLFDSISTSTLAGASTFSTLQLASGKSCYLEATTLFTIGTFNAIGTTSSQISLLTTAGGTTSGFVVTTIGNVRYVRATDINSAAGIAVFDKFGTLSNTTNWVTWAAGDSYFVTSATANDVMDLYVDGDLVVRWDAL